MFPRCRSITVLAALVGMATILPTATSTAAPSPPRAPGHYIVVLHDNVTDSGAVANEHRARYGANVSFVYGSALKGYAAQIPDANLARVRADRRVQFVGMDGEVAASAQQVPTGIHRIGGPISSQLSGNGSGALSGVAVAVIDTGSGPHSDLNIVGGKNCQTGKSYNDGNGHGTHVAGSIGAKDDGAGVVGIAPGVPIYSVRVLNNYGSGSWSSVACGIDWVTANASRLGIKVANLSLGGPGADDGNCGNTNNDALHKAICGSVAAGVTYVVAAGNSGVDFQGSIPAAYDKVLAVTAVADFNGQPGGGGASTCRADVDETAADFSNFATLTADQAHTIAAPGVCILSTWKGGGYNTISGTSMAAPHVSGVAALCIATGACLGSPASVMTKLRDDAAAQLVAYGFTGDPRSASGSRYYGYLTYAGGY